MMTDLTERSSCDKPVHGNIDIFTITGNRCFGIKVVLGPYGSP